MEFKGTKSILTMPCGATSGTNQDRPSNVVYSKGKILAKFYGENPEEATANAKIFTCANEMLELLNKFHLLLEEHQPNWYLLGHHNELLELRKKATTI